MRPLKQAVYSSRTADKFVVRLPDGMRERIAEAARSHHRSMNSEIIARLDRSLLEESTDDASQGETRSNYTENLIRRLDVQPWTPQVGQLVRRIDSDEILGSIARFKMSSSGLMAVIAGFDDVPGGRPVPAQAVGLLRPVDISEVIEKSSSSVHRALERIAEQAK